MREVIWKSGASRVRLLVQTSFGCVSGRALRQPHKFAESDLPLVIAIHGGSYTSRYFDVPGYSLLERANEAGITAIALDRPGYGESTSLRSGEEMINRNAEYLDETIGVICENMKGGPGVVLIGHSIGAAVVVAIAARKLKWPLLGIAVSGVSLRPAPDCGEVWSTLPEGVSTVPSELKNAAMFGPMSTYSNPMPSASYIADAPVPREELMDIVYGWPALVQQAAERITVPIHYRLGEFDSLAANGFDEVQAFGEAFINSRSVDAAAYPAAGHCIDFHHGGAAFQREQLAFALLCATSADAEFK